MIMRISKISFNNKLMFEAHTLFVTKFIDFHTYFTLIVIALAIISYVTEKTYP